MRVLFTCYPENTHFMAMAPLAWALRTAGHEVRFASQPRFADTITQAGLTAVVVGGDRDLWQIMRRDMNWITAGVGGLPTPYDTADWRPQDVTWDYLQDGYHLHVGKWHKSSNMPMISDLVAFAQEWKPDLVLWEPSTYAGAIAAKACGAAHARLLFGIDIFGVTRDHYLRLREERPPDDRPDPLADWLGGYARKYGFAFSEDLVTGQFSISLVPPSLQTAANLTYLPLRYVPYGGSAVIPDWLRIPPERPRVAITLGLTTAAWAGYVIGMQEILDGLADLDIELVVTLSEDEQRDLEYVPANVRLVTYVPLHALVPTCSAVIHHAGFGTLVTTALHGVPQLVLPWDDDAPILARRVAAQGAGLAIHTHQIDGASIRNRLLRLLGEPRFTRDADRLRAEVLAMPTPNELVGPLEKLASPGEG